MELWLVYCAFGTYVVSLLCNGANPNRGLSCQNETQLQTVEEEKKRSAQKDREREKEREGGRRLVEPHQALQPSRSPALHAQTTMTHNHQPTATLHPLNPLQVTGVCV